MPATHKCWKCHTEYPPEVVVCVKCGINVVTGKELGTKLGEEDAAAPTGSPARALNWLGDSLPGLFRPTVLVGTAVLAVVAAVLVWLCLVLLMMAPIGAIGVGVVGVIVYAQGLVWLINGEFSVLQTGLTEFRGKDWSTLAVLIIVPFTLVFALMGHAQRVEQQANEPPPPPKVEPPPAPGEFNIIAVPQTPDANGYSGGRVRSPLAADSAGNLYWADVEGCYVWKLAPATGALTVIAGTGEKDWGRDGTLATKAALNYPTSVAVDSKGIVYILDGRRIRRLDEKGLLTTCAGQVAEGADGDGGPAKDAKLKLESRLVMDARDNLYILHTPTGHIRKVDSKGIITSVAGTEQWGFGGDGGAAVAAQFHGALAMAVDAKGNLYIADTNNNRIRKVDAATGLVDTIAGTGERGKRGNEGIGGPAKAMKLVLPTCIAVDEKGHVFFGNEFHYVYKINAATGLISVVAGTGIPGDAGNGGPANHAQVSSVGSLLIDAKGTFYIGDDRNRRVRKLVYAGAGLEPAAKKR